MATTIHPWIPQWMMTQPFCLGSRSVPPALGVISDFKRTQSSFSTKAALGNGVPMLYLGRRQHHNMFSLQKSVNDMQPMRNYFLGDRLQFAMFVTHKRKPLVIDSLNKQGEPSKIQRLVKSHINQENGHNFCHWPWTNETNRIASVELHRCHHHRRSHLDLSLIHI